MFKQSGSLVLQFLFVFSVECTLVNPPSVENTFRQCLLSVPVGTGGVGQCLGVGVLGKLQSWDNEPEFDLVDGLTLTRDPQEYREVYNLADSDPASFRSIVDSIGQVFSRRQMRWDMSSIYPGLILRVAPSPGTAGFLEFVLDPHMEAVNRHRLKEASTAKLLAGSFLVPVLLGFKLKVISFLPIIIGIVALMAKKALVLSKLALVFSTAIGLASLLFGSFGGNYQGQGTGPQVFTPPYAPPYHINRYPEHHYAEDSSYRANNNLGDSIDNEEEASNDQIKLPENLQEIFSTGVVGKTDRQSRRNFAWNEEEKLKKIT